MLKLAPIETRRWRAQLRLSERFSKWDWSFEIVGAQGGVHLHISGPHVYDGRENWSAGLEFHSRTATDDEPPSHARCWLLDAPCWHEGTSSYPQERYMPLWHAGHYDEIFRKMIRDADKFFYPESGDAAGVKP